MSEFLSFLVTGIVTGAIYAVTASGLVVTYKATGIFNFAHGTVGMVLAYLYWQFWQGWGWNPVLSLVLVLLVVAPLSALLIERLLMRPLYGAPLNTAIVVTLGLFLVLYGGTSTIWNQTTTRDLPTWFTNDQVTLFNVTLSYEQLITIGCAVGVAVGLWLFFKRTRTGVAMRAVVDDPALASLTGARSSRISGLAWMFGFMLAGLAGILVAPGTGMSIQILSELVIFGYAAAIVGRLSSLPMTFVGAMILGVGESMAVGYAPANLLNDISAVLPMGLLIVALLLMPQARLATARVTRGRPPRTATFRQTLLGATALVVGAVLLSYLITGTNLYALGLALTLGMACLSLVLLSGWGGQVWLCQFTFMGLAAWTMSKVDGGSSWLGVLAAVGVCAAAGGLLSLPALRLRGLYMALASLAFAALMDSIFFNNPSVVSGGSIQVGRPELFGMHFVTDRSFTIFLSVVFALCLVGVGAIRRGPFGRRLVAMSDSQAASATVGMNIVGTKLAMFVMAGALAGLAGALYGGMSQTVSVGQFSFPNSLVLFVAIVLSGATILYGSVQAGITLAYVPVIATHIPSVAGFTYIGFGIGIVAAGRNPFGMGRVWNDLGDWWAARRAGLTADGSAPPGASGGADGEKNVGGALASGVGTGG